MTIYINKNLKTRVMGAKGISKLMALTSRGRDSDEMMRHI